MVSGPIVHVIATIALIIVLMSITLYSYVNITLMVNENLRNIFKAIADSYASTIRLLYEEKTNNTIARINNPIEVSSRKYYNVYIGYGKSLSELFPNIRNDPGYNDYNLYVVVSLPDRSIYAYSRALTVNEPGTPPVLLGRGKVYRMPEYKGFLPGQGYTEGGFQWVCRLPINIVERSGNDLRNYLVPITLNLSTMKCTYQGKTYTPSKNDIRFTDSDGKTRLDYWIEYWNETEGLAKVWVKLNIPSSSTKTIFAYWGQPLARSLSDPNIFIMYEDLGKYYNLTDLLNSGNWHLRTEGISSYTGENYVLYYSGSTYNGILINATLEKLYRDAFLDIFSAKYFQIGDQGFICEGLVAPFTENAHDVTFSLYNSTTEEALFDFSVKSEVYDYYTSEVDLLNYTVIWGDWGIGTLYDTNNNESYNVLVGNNTDTPKGLPEVYKVAAIVRKNAEYQSSGTGQAHGQENFTFIAKLYIEPDGVYRGVLISENRSIYLSSINTMGIGLVEDASGLRLVRTDIPEFITTTLSNTDIYNYSGWVYLKVSARGPGQANPAWDIYVYDQGGDLLIEFHDRGTYLGSLDPNYIGFYSYSDLGIETSFYFQTLVSTVYNVKDIGDILGEEYLDIGTIYVLGLPPGWNITIYDSGYNKVYAAEVQDNGIAYINVTLTPILGINGTLYFTIRDQYGNPAYYFKKDIVIPGGSIIRINLGIDNPTTSVMVGLHAIGERNFDWYVVYNLDGSSYTEDELISATTGTPIILGVGLYNSKAYYFIYDQNYNLEASGSTSFPTNGIYRIVFGPAKISDNKEQFTSGFYSWIRVRPFVYPEPLAEPWYDAIESLAILSPPVIKYNIVSDYVVFGSPLMVDLALVIQNGQMTIVVLFEGVRHS